MHKINIFDIKGTEFPAGRRTRVILGENGAINGDHFCQGYSVIYPNGGIPEHSHPAVETYTILQGNGIMKVDGETQDITVGDVVYIESGVPHTLHNTGDQEMHMMFVYAPKMIVDHWAEESEGKLHQGSNEA